MNRRERQRIARAVAAVEPARRQAAGAVAAWAIAGQVEPVSALAARLGVSRQAVYRLCEALGVTPRRATRSSWSKAEDTAIAVWEQSRDEPAEAVAKRLGRSVGAVYQRAAVLRRRRRAR